MKLVGNTTSLVKAVYQDNKISEQIFLIQVNREILANTWLNIIFTAFSGNIGSAMASSGYY